jgi:CHAT domain-containing protein
MLADRVDAYGDLVIALLALGRLGEAFVIADQARSRALLENISAARGDSAGPLPRQLANADALLRRIDALVQRLRETDRGTPQERGLAASSADADLAAELIDARNRYEALLVRGVRQDPRAGAMLGAVTPPVAAVQAALRPGQALIEYLLSSGRLVVFVVTADSIRVSQDTLDGAALTARVRLLRDLWGTSRPDWRSGLATARALHRALIAPALNAGWLDAVQDLVIVPHGILGQLPFAALQDDRTGRFLVQDFAVSHLPSAAVLATTGSPGDLENWIAGGSGFAPFPEDLPSSAIEIRAFGNQTRASMLHLGDEATESELRRALASPRLVHVATHGILNGRNPMFSRIELARPRNSMHGDDGRLEVHELLGLTVRSPLVFFSGCQTGAGHEWTEDPVLGTADLTLAQAVLAAGASQVISTLWRIDDAGAAAFATEFYQRLRLGPVAGSFATAQRSIASSGKFASPYYWAGYLLSGRNNPARHSLASGNRP